MFDRLRLLFVKGDTGGLRGGQGDCRRLSEMVCGRLVVVVVVVVVVKTWRLELTQRSPLNSAWLLYLTSIIVRSTARNNKRLHHRNSYVIILIPERRI